MGDLIDFQKAKNRLLGVKDIQENSNNRTTEKLKLRRKRSRQQVIDIHTEHCCEIHQRCVYNSGSNCTVVAGGEPMTHACDCDV
jgi:hypothetical protein